MLEEELEGIAIQNKKNHRSFIKGALIGALSMLILAAIVGIVAVVQIFGGGSVINTTTMQEIEVIQSYVEDRYLYDVDSDAIQDGILAGYLDALDDPYTAYYNEQETADLLESTTGEYSGIGATMLQDTSTGIITILNVFMDSPAEKSGVEDGDILYKVNGIEVTGEDVSVVVLDIKGEAGTTVEITVLRGEDYEEFTYVITRENIEYQSVSYEMMEEQVGYILIEEFDDLTLGQFEEAFQELEEQGMESLIVDLRSNPGGNLSTVCDILDLLLPEGLIVYTEDKDGNRDEYYSSGDDEFALPMVVLVNEYSASASEIFASAIQDYGIGEIVGMTTYGKGVVQQLISLGDGTMIKLTTSEYYSPLGNQIHGVGVIPDVEVEYDYTDLETDEQLDMALEVIKELSE